MSVNRGIVCGYSHILIALLMVVSNSLGEGNVPVEMICLQENVVLQWDILKYSKMDYAYIQHGPELIVTIVSLTDIIIEDEFKSQVQINITEPLQIEMTILNVTQERNGIYTCTIGVLGKQELILKKEISVIDPDITLSLDTDYNDCKTLKCSSKYQVALLDPTGRKIDNNRCLFKNETGKYSCCLLNQRCSSSNCKFIYIDDYGYTFPSVNTGKTTLFEASSETVDKSDTTLFINIFIALILLVLFMCICGSRVCLTRQRRIRKDETSDETDQSITGDETRDETNNETDQSITGDETRDETNNETDQSITDFVIEGIKHQFVSLPLLLSKRRRTKPT